MRQLLAKAKHPGHLYPMAMCSWEIMPPPEKLEKHLGERRRTKHAGTGAQPGAAAYGECVCVLMGLWDLLLKELPQIPSTPAQVHCQLMLQIWCVPLLIPYLHPVSYRGSNAECIRGRRNCMI